MQEEFRAEELLEIVRVVLKDELTAVIRRRGDELTITFPGGERYVLTVWRESFGRKVVDKGKEA